MRRLYIVLASLAVVLLLALPMAWRNGRPALPTLSSPSAETGFETRRLWEGPDPAIWGTSVSPDGLYLSQVDWSRYGNVVAFDLASRATQMVTDMSADVIEGDAPGWGEMTHFSADGRKIAYTWAAPPEWEYEVRVRNVDGSGEQVLWRSLDDREGEGGLGSVSWWPGLHGWMPDGSGVLVTLWSSRNDVAIWLLPLDGSPKQMIYRPEAGRVFTGQVAASPDGRYVVFDEADVWSPETPDPPQNMYALPLAGGGDPVAIAPSASLDGVIGWTTDGRLVFYSHRNQSEGVWSVAVRDGRQVGEPSLLKGDLWGLEPIGIAGDAVYYGIRTQASQVHTVGISTESRRLVGEPRPVEAESRPSNRPAWSPDGRYLAYRADPPSTPGVFLVIRSASGNSTQEVGPFQRIRDVTWDASGGSVHIAGELPGDANKFSWFTFDLATGEIDRVRASIDGLRCANPTVMHPDGRRQFCKGFVLGPESGQVVALDRGSLEFDVVWEPDPGGFGPLSLSPDGSRLAFWQSEAGGVRALEVLPTDGGAPRELLRVSSESDDGRHWCFSAAASLPLWLPDGEHLLIERPSRRVEGEESGPGACEVQLVSLTGLDPVTLGTLPRHSEWTLSPDGTQLAIVTGESRGEIWVLEAAR